MLQQVVSRLCAVVLNANISLYHLANALNFFFCLKQTAMLMSLTSEVQPFDQDAACTLCEGMGRLSNYSYPLL